MSFPQTQHTLIQRIAEGGEDRDWELFLADYWGPICRFARRRGASTWEDAEDVAAQTVVALLHNRLLARWVITQSARLRTLLCTVVRHVLANRARVEGGRARLLRHQGRVVLPDALDATTEQEDAFYAAWVDELVHRTVDRLLEHLHEEGRGDHFRILHGRICEEMTFPEIARVLNLSVGQAEAAYKQARLRLGHLLEDLLRLHVCRYCHPEHAAAEFTTEWRRLGQHLQTHGELEAAIRRSFETGVPARPSGIQAVRTLAKRP